jgi:2,4-dienoyl-CoA reductase-like NADH-dependent reductase (Old Yellow Enzyme family)
MSTAAGDPDLSTLWESVSLGPIAVRNRIMMGPTTLLYAVDNVLSDRHVAFYAERAQGGAGLLVSEEHGAFRLGIGAFATACTAWHERAVPRFAALADAVHAHGSHQLIQLYAPGANDDSALVMDQWRAPWAASRIPGPGSATMPVAMDSEQIAEVVDGFAASARNVEIGGLDGVEIHAAHSWLVGQFLSPHFNRRTDAYGGSVAGRCRLAIEIGEAIRARTCRLVVGIQLSLDEYIGAAGISARDTEDQVELLAASGLFDYVNLSTGGSFSTHRTIPTMEVAEGFLAEPGARIREIVAGRMKVVLVGRVRSLEMAARLVEEGSADIVAMTRAQLADPELVRKGMAGRSGEIVPCIGENDCIVRALGAQLPVTCLMNPAMGHEAVWGRGRLTQAASPRRLAVIGGGPAGLKLAATAARRGHEVDLYECREALGGHLEPLSRLPHRGAWQEAIASLAGDARSAGVRIHLGATADDAVLAALAPDAVVCATGAGWDRTGISPGVPGSAPPAGADQDTVVDIGTALAHALDDPSALGRHVIIVDESGEYLPLGLADLLSQAGAAVDIVSRHPVVGATVHDALDAPHVLGRLAARAVRLIPGHLLERTRGDRVELREVWSGRERAIDGVDTVILSLLRTPDDALFRELSRHHPDVRRVGDALAPRRTHEVIHEAEAMGRAL